MLPHWDGLRGDALAPPQVVFSLISSLSFLQTSFFLTHPSVYLSNQNPIYITDRLIHALFLKTPNHFQFVINLHPHKHLSFLPMFFYNQSPHGGSHLSPWLASVYWPALNGFKPHPASLLSPSYLHPLTSSSQISEHTNWPTDRQAERSHMAYSLPVAGGSHQRLLTTTPLSRGQTEGEMKENGKFRERGRRLGGVLIRSKILIHLLKTGVYKSV